MVQFGSLFKYELGEFVRLAVNKDARIHIARRVAYESPGGIDATYFGRIVHSGEIDSSLVEFDEIELVPDDPRTMNEKADAWLESVSKKPATPAESGPLPSVQVVNKADRDAVVRDAMGRLNMDTARDCVREVVG